MTKYNITQKEKSKKRFTKELEENEYKLASEYNGVMKEVTLKCPIGHIWKTRPNNFRNGQRCPVCSGNCTKHAKTKFIELLKKEGYTLLSEYKDNKTKVDLECPNGHKWSVSSNGFNRGNRCYYCSSQNKNKAQKRFLKLVHKDGYELLSEYKSNKTKVKLICNNGHIFKVRPDNFINKYSRCPHCKGSTGQRKLQSLLEENTNHKMIYNDRTVLNGLELDIYFPELNIAIEYQGDYWHNLENVKERDKRKRQLCKELGIHLIEVWDSEFIKNEELVFNNIIKVI